MKYNSSITFTELEKRDLSSSFELIVQVVIIEKNN